MLREELARHFDVVVVIWVLALAVGWSIACLTHCELNNDQWSQQQQNGPVWMIGEDPAP